jgi:SAM-dependent methyltransferase
VSTPKVIGGRRSHDVLRRELAKGTPGRVLDAPAGTGVLAQYLRGLGWEVHCADIDCGNFELQGFPFTEVNLNRPLPFDDCSFDAVVCANGLHRLFNPGGAIREFFRLLVPGGRLYVTVNNYASLDMRLRFLIYGSLCNTVNQGCFDQTIDDPEANVRHHLFYPQLANLLEQAGFQIARARAASLKPRHVLLAPLALPIWLASWIVAPSTARKNRIGETRRPPVFPGGKYLYLESHKPTVPARP